MRAWLKIRDLPAYRRDAFEAGLRASGWSVHASRSQPFVPESRDDLLVVWNRMKFFEPQCEKWEAEGGTVLVAENGYIQPENLTDETRRYALSVGDHNGAGWVPFLGSARAVGQGLWSVPRVLANIDKPNILVLGQRGIGSTLMASPARWAEKTVREIKSGGGPTLAYSSVKIRQHPGLVDTCPTLREDLVGIDLVLTWASGAAVQALAWGYPVLYYAPFWVAQAATGFYPEPDKIQAAMNNVANGQWSVAEIADGKPFRVMREMKWGRA